MSMDINLAKPNKIKFSIASLFTSIKIKRDGEYWYYDEYGGIEWLLAIEKKGLGVLIKTTNRSQCGKTRFLF